jgi:hypothetical protein
VCPAASLQRNHIAGDKYQFICSTFNNLQKAQVVHLGSQPLEMTAWDSRYFSNPHLPRGHGMGRSFCRHQQEHLKSRLSTPDQTDTRSLRRGTAKIASFRRMQRPVTWKTSPRPQTVLARQGFGHSNAPWRAVGSLSSRRCTRPRLRSGASLASATQFSNDTITSQRAELEFPKTSESDRTLLWRSAASSGKGVCSRRRADGHDQS